eukprot:CAMPEP_0183814972 /NCGR_PEP_ID=MMETSP0803_2-20130417/56016_1 /TAXON_ID=195967 /ORGANISM="Crustomastix stigmata, Strain CCMP3273" /LENGTH=208 /DNA_ID=CAMNT_0026059837 /DNA_START=154 /DNA_END=777 /DNA_ORIENTATION=+
MNAAGETTRIQLGTLRLFRGLMALRDYKFIASILAIMDALGRSLPLLVDVIILTLIVGVFYALMGISFFSNSLTRRCALWPGYDQEAGTGPGLPLAVSVQDLFCNSLDNDPEITKGFTCPGVEGYKVEGPPSDLYCVNWGNPNMGNTSFDTILYALLTMFQSITLEDWQVAMYAMIDAEFKISAMYFITLIIIGTFFLINVFVAAISG